MVVFGAERLLCLCRMHSPRFDEFSNCDGMGCDRRVAGDAMYCF